MYKDTSTAFKAGVLQKCAELGLDKNDEAIISKMFEGIADAPDFMTHLKSAAGTWAGDTEDLPTGFWDTTAQGFKNIPSTTWEGIKYPFDVASDTYGQSMGNWWNPIIRPSAAGVGAKRQRIAQKDDAAAQAAAAARKSWPDNPYNDLITSHVDKAKSDKAERDAKVLFALTGKQPAPKPEGPFGPRVAAVPPTTAPSPAPTPVPSWMTDSVATSSPADGSYTSTYPGDQPAVAAAPPPAPATPVAPAAPPPPPQYAMTNQGRQELLPQEQRGIFMSPETQQLMAANRAPKVKWQPGAPGGLPPEQAVAAAPPPAPMAKPSSAHAKALVGYAIKESIANVLNGLQGKQWQPATAPATFKTPAAGKIPTAPQKGKPAKPATPATPKYSGTAPAPTFSGSAKK